MTSPFSMFSIACLILCLLSGIVAGANAQEAAHASALVSAHAQTTAPQKPKPLVITIPGRRPAKNAGAHIIEIRPTNQRDGFERYNSKTRRWERYTPGQVR